MEDAQIIGLYWERSEAAVKETENKYGRLCRSIIGNILKFNEDIEECVNDTYLGVWNAIPPQRPQSFMAFICRVARNLALKKYEYLTAQKRNSNASVSLDELNECISGSTENLNIDDIEEIGTVISDFLRKLDADSRNIFLRRYWHFDSIESIAKRFRMSNSKVTSMLFRTRNKLKLALEKEGIIL